MWHKYVNIAVLSYNTSYTSIGCEPSRVFHGSVPCNVLDLKLGIHPQKKHHQIQILQKMFSNKRNWFSTMSERTPCKLISDTKRTMIRKLMSPNSKNKNMRLSYSLKQISREAKSLHRLSVDRNLHCWKGLTKKQLFGTKTRNEQNPSLSSHEIASIHAHTNHTRRKNNIRDWKPDPEVIMEHDDLYARAWASEYETPIFDNGQYEPDSNNLPQITVRHDLPNEHYWCQSAYC